MIREATEADIGAIVSLVVRFGVERDHRDNVTNQPELIGAIIDTVLASSDGAVFVLEHEGEVVGVIVLVLTQHPLSGEITASELVWYVAPECRGKGLLLLRRAEKWARERDAVRLQVVAPNDQVETVYRRFGYDPMEPIYVKALR